MGLDPELDSLALEHGGGNSLSDDLAAVVRRNSCNLIEAVADFCIAIKPQLARFELLGSSGWRVLKEIVDFAQTCGLLVIADGKRGDVPHTAKVYAQALFAGVETEGGRLAGLGVDAATVNPLLGRDSIQPFLETAAESGAGVFVLVRTSNPGASDIQDLLSSDRPIYEHLAQMTAELAQQYLDDSGLSSVGAVVGATEPKHLSSLRKLMPKSVLLIPGVGAQGGNVGDLGPAFTAGPASALVTAARSIEGAYKVSGGEPLAAARQEAERLAVETWRVSSII